MENTIEVMEQDQRDYLKGLLTEEKVRILFTKVDGTTSELIGSTSPKYLPIVVEAFVENDEEPVVKKVRKTNLAVLTLFNIEKQAWRSVKYDLIQNFEIVD